MLILEYGILKRYKLLSKASAFIYHRNLSSFYKVADFYEFV